MKRLITVLILIFSIFELRSDILSTDNQFDYIVVYHNEFKSEIDEYIKWRKAQGVNITAIELNEIYKYFKNNETSEQQAIRGFVSFTLTYWQKPAPKYLLICGSINHIPSFKVKSNMQFYEDSISVDFYYSINENDPDELPDISIGRLPARNLEQMDAMFDKIYDYEGIGFNRSYSKDFLNVVDSKDSASFEKISEKLIENHFPSQSKIDRAYFSDDSPYHSDVIGFHEKLNRSLRFLNYIGHGHPDSWSHEKILTTDHIDTLTFADQSFVMLTLACSQNFDDPDKQGLAEKLLSKEKGGALLTIGSSGINMSSIVGEFGSEFYNTLLNNTDLRIGDVLKKIISKHNSDFFKRFTLLGDPYLLLHNNDIIAGNAESKNVDAEYYTAHPNPFFEKTNIDLEILETKNISISIYDFSGKKIADIFSGLLSRGTHNFSWIADGYDSGVYFCKIEKKDETIVIPLIIEK